MALSDELTASMQRMMDAIASGNREKYEAEQARYRDLSRQQWSDQYGYDRGSEFGGGQPRFGATGSTKTVEQLRAELRAAGGSIDGLSDQQVIDLYNRTAKPEDRYRSQQDGQATGEQTTGALINSLYKRAKAAGQDPVQAITSATGLRPDEVAKILQAGRTFYINTGTEIAPEHVDQIIRSLPGREFGINPTLDARRFGEGQRQFNVSEKNKMGVNLATLGSQLRGPRDWQRYGEAMSGGKTLLDQLRGGESQRGTGFTGQPEPFRIVDLLRDLGMLEEGVA